MADALANLACWLSADEDRSYELLSGSRWTGRKLELHLMDDDRHIIQPETAQCVGESAVIEAALARWGMKT